MTITEEDREMDDNDSEDPEDGNSEMLEDRYRQVDPQLDAKIRAIRQGQSISDDRQSSSAAIGQNGSSSNYADYRRANANSKSSLGPSNQNAPTTVDEQQSAQ